MNAGFTNPPKRENEIEIVEYNEFVKVACTEGLVHKLNSIHPNLEVSIRTVELSKLKMCISNYLGTYWVDYLTRYQVADKRHK